jgi:amino acid permease
MWNNIFFLYSVLVMILSGIVSAKLADVASAKVKYLNEIVLALSVALAAFVMGIMFGQSSYACSSKKNLKDLSIVSQVALLVIAIIIEGLLIGIVSSAEFADLEGATEAKRLIIGMLVLNSLGLVGGVVFVANPHLRQLPSCPNGGGRRLGSIGHGRRLD